MITKVKNIYLCDSEWIEQIWLLNWKAYNNLPYWWIVFEDINWIFYNYTSSDSMFPFMELK